MGRFQRDVAWRSSTVVTEASSLVREMLVTHAREYLEGGAEAVGLSADKDPPQSRFISS